MKTQSKMESMLLKALLAAAIITISACANTPLPDSEYTADEPFVVTDDQNVQAAEPEAEQINEPFQSESGTETTLEAGIEEASPAESSYTAEPVSDSSSGISEPVEEIDYNEPAAEPVDRMVDEEAGEHMTDEPMAETSSAIVSNDINEIPADYYTVQIVAASTVENLKAFANDHNIDSNITAQINVDGKVWQILLLGTYPTLAEAKEALASIEGKYDTTPWIRSIDSVQKISR